MRVFSLHRGLIFCTFLAFSSLAALGCGGGESLYPVSGKVYSDTKPLTGGTVTFIPDTSKGNTTKFSPGSKIGSDGTYSLISGGKPGAPLGAYKVAIVTDAPGEPPSTVKLAPRFADPEKSELHIEVVANPEPNKYDLRGTP